MKITKEKLKQIIKEEIGGQFLGTNSGPLSMQPNFGATLRNYAPTGKPPDNQSKPSYEGRPPYETLGVVNETEAGEEYITIGKIKYKLVFDNKQNTSGRVEPVDEYKFTIEESGVSWNEDVPTHVRFDSHLEKQIMEYSGREGKIK